MSAIYNYAPNHVKSIGAVWYNMLGRFRQAGQVETVSQATPSQPAPGWVPAWKCLVQEFDSTLKLNYTSTNFKNGLAYSVVPIRFICRKTIVLYRSEQMVKNLLTVTKNWFCLPVLYTWYCSRSNMTPNVDRFSQKQRIKKKRRKNVGNGWFLECINLPHGSTCPGLCMLSKLSIRPKLKKY